MKFNKLIDTCKKLNLSEEDAIILINRKWVFKRSIFKQSNFMLYAKERIKQKNLKNCLQHGSKKKAVENITKSNEFITNWNKIKGGDGVPLNYERNIHNLYYLVTDSRQKNDLLNAFKNEGESEII